MISVSRAKYVNFLYLSLLFTVKIKYKGLFSIDYRERGFHDSHARGAYPAQDTWRMGTARVKQEEEADTKIMRE